MKNKTKAENIDMTESNEDQLWMLVGEETLKKTWDNPHDERWDDVL